MTVHFRTLCTGAIIALGLAVLQSSSNAQTQSAAAGPLGPSVVPSTPRTEGPQPSTIPINVHIAISSLREQLVQTIVRDKPQAGGHLPCAGWKQGSVLVRDVPVHNIGEIPEDMVEEVVEKDPVLRGVLVVLTGGASEIHRFVHHTVMKPINKLTNSDIEVGYGLDINNLALALQGDRIAMTADLSFSLSGEVKKSGLVPVGIKQIDHGTAKVVITGKPHWTDAGALDLEGVTADVDYQVSGVLTAFQILPDQILGKELLKSFLADLMKDTVSKESFNSVAGELSRVIQTPKRLQSGLWLAMNVSEVQLSDWSAIDGGLHTVATLVANPLVSQDEPKPSAAPKIRKRGTDEGIAPFFVNLPIQVDYKTFSRLLASAAGAKQLPFKPQIGSGTAPNELLIVVAVPKGPTFKSKATIGLKDDGKKIVLSRQPFSSDQGGVVNNFFKELLDGVPKEVSVDINKIARDLNIEDARLGLRVEVKDVHAEGLVVGSNGLGFRLVSRDGLARLRR